MNLSPINLFSGALALVIVFAVIMTASKGSR